MAKNYSLSETGLNLIKKFEGCKLTAYRDVANIPTIGYGHTKTVTAKDVENKKRITQSEADYLLRQDVAHFEKGVNKLINENNLNLKQNQFDALVSFSYNVGLGALSKSTLMKKLYLMNQNDQASVYAVADQFLRWNKAGGKVWQGLVNRRNEERLLFLGVKK